MLWLVAFAQSLGGGGGDYKTAPPAANSRRRDVIYDAAAKVNDDARIESGGAQPADHVSGGRLSLLARRKQRAPYSATMRRTKQVPPAAQANSTSDLRVFYRHI